MMTTTLMIYKKVKMRMEERIMILDHKNDDRHKREADSGYDDDDYDDNMNYD